MRSTTVLSTAAFILIFAAHANVASQTRPSGVPVQSANAQVPRNETSNADEEFDLNIDQRRISEGDYHAETAVSTDGAHGLQLNVGVAVRASDIVVTLRNVRGHVRFRASLDAVLRVLDTQRVAEPQSRAAPAPP